MTPQQICISILITNMYHCMDQILTDNHLFSPYLRHKQINDNLLESYFIRIFFIVYRFKKNDMFFFIGSTSHHASIIFVYFCRLTCMILIIHLWKVNTVVEWQALCRSDVNCIPALQALQDCGVAHNLHITVAQNDFSLCCKEKNHFVQLCLPLLGWIPSVVRSWWSL